MATILLVIEGRVRCFYGGDPNMISVFFLLENIARDAALPEPSSAHHNCQEPNPG
jgi:hypothetical protein